MDKEDVVYICNGMLSSLGKKEIWPFTTTWMELEGIMLSEISQTDKDTYTVWSHQYAESKKQSKLKKMKTDSYREQMGGVRGHGVGGVGEIG